MKITDPGAETLKAKIAGDLTVLDGVLLAIQSGIYNLAVRVPGQRDDAADATQEILQKVVTHLSSFRNKSAFTTWVWRVVQNHLMSARTRSAEAGEVSLEGLAEQLGMGLDFAASMAQAQREPMPRKAQDKLEALQVATGSGYWRDWATPSRRKAPRMLHLASPLLTPFFGYFPGKAPRMVGDLSGPAMRQWTAWCRHPEFAWGAEPERVLPSLKSAFFRIEAYGFSDDEAMTQTCTRKLLAALPNAASALHVLAPGDVGMRVIGHVGAFRREAAAALWPRLAASLSTAG